MTGNYTSPFTYDDNNDDYKERYLLSQFNCLKTSDVTVTLKIEQGDDIGQCYLHRMILCQSKFFRSLLNMDKRRDEITVFLPLSLFCSTEYYPIICTFFRMFYMKQRDTAMDDMPLDMLLSLYSVCFYFFFDTGLKWTSTLIISKLSKETMCTIANYAFYRSHMELLRETVHWICVYSIDMTKEQWNCLDMEVVKLVQLNEYCLSLSRGNRLAFHLTIYPSVTDHLVGTLYCDQHQPLTISVERGLLTVQHEKSSRCCRSYTVVLYTVTQKEWFVRQYTLSDNHKNVIALEDSIPQLKERECFENSFIGCILTIKECSHDVQTHSHVK